MIQPNYVPDSPDFPAHQARIVTAMVAALQAAEVRRIVSLSSWGADKASGTGPVVGLHRMEKQIDGLAANITHLRAGYFMENLLGQTGRIRSQGIVAAPFEPDLAMPFIAAADIGRVAARELVGSGKPHVLELHGERDLSMADATAVISSLAGRPELRYVQQTIDDFASEQLAAGVSRSVTDLMVEVARAINSGHTATLQPRTPASSTPTGIETFVREAMLPELR